VAQLEAPFEQCLEVAFAQQLQIGAQGLDLCRGGVMVQKRLRRIVECLRRG
jgi:hypothetical protein